MFDAYESGGMFNRMSMRYNGTSSNNNIEHNWLIDNMCMTGKFNFTQLLAAKLHDTPHLIIKRVDAAT